MKRLLIFFIIAVVFSACGLKEESDVESIALRITHSELEFPYNETSYPVSVMTDRPWILESDSEWLSASIEGADYGVSFNILAERNEGSSRRGVITVSNDLGSMTINVLQKADDRNFTEIYFTSQPTGYERVKDAFLVIPYRHGDGAVLDLLSVSVAGSAKGSISVETLEQVRLEDGEGEIRMKVEGRVGGAGKLLFTVSGLPPVVFGEATQCMVDIKGTEELADYGINDLRSLPAGVIAPACRTTGIVISKVKPDLPGVEEIVVQDESAGIVIRVPEGERPLEFGDECEIFLKDAMMTQVGGLKTVILENTDDLKVISKGNDVESIELVTASFETYESMLCHIADAQVAASDLGKPSCAGTTIMERYGWSEIFYMYVPQTASFSYSGIPSGSGILVGIVGKDEMGNWAICPQEEINGMTSGRLDLTASLSVDSEQLNNISDAGCEGLFFKVASTVPWSLSSDDDGWLYDWSTVSGVGGGAQETVYVSVRPNSGPRRSARITISGTGVPDCVLTIIQKEGARILDEDFSMIRQQLLEDPKYFPSSASIDYAKSLASVGLDGWFSTNCYGSLSPDGEYGLMRIGKTLTKGYIQTPSFTAVGPNPVTVEVNFLAGIFRGCVATWIGLELEGPGRIVTGDDVSYLAVYDDVHTDDLVDKLPFHLVDGLSSSELKRVTVRIDGVTEDTSLRFTATCKGGASATLCNMFFIGDVHVEYAD